MSMMLMLMGLAACASPKPSGSPPDTGMTDERCTVATYVTDDCDRCENTKCCAERFACYDDYKCFWGDRHLDECLADGGTSGDGGSGGDAGAGPCWSTFRAVDDAAAARYACKLDRCKSVCAVP